MRMFFYLQLEHPGLVGFGLDVVVEAGLNIIGLCAIIVYF